MSIAIIDLDGTLVTCNSFSRFVLFSFRRIPALRMRLAYTVALRKLRIISHHRAKERIVEMVSPRFEPLLNDFLSSLRPYYRREVLEIHATSDFSVLATAAPALYAVPLGRYLGFNAVTATLPGHPENKSEEKLRSILALNIPLGPGTTVVTDHSDDLPLLNANKGGKNIIV